MSMAIEVSSSIQGDVAEIVLSGELDAAAAPRFQQELEHVAAARPRRLVLHMRDLSFMASAGIRMLIFARQKMGAGVVIHIISPQEPVLDTLHRTGMYASVLIQQEYQPTD
jgi:anti-anti-sigma factor